MFSEKFRKVFSFGCSNEQTNKQSSDSREKLGLSLNGFCRYVFDDVGGLQLWADITVGGQ